MKATVDEARDGGILPRLAVIENKLQILLEEVAAIREYIPAKAVEHTERIFVLERNMRAMQWIAGVFAAAIIGAFVAHVIGN